MPAGSTLTRVDVTAEAVSEAASGAFVAATWALGNFYWGIQWLASGGTPASLTANPITTGSWLDLNSVRPRTVNNLLAVAATTYINDSELQVNQRWRGLFTIPFALDIYWSFGQDTSSGITSDYRAYGSFYVEWATFP